MNLILLFILALSYRETLARSYWSEKPKVIAADEMNDGETVEISCTLPIDYRGGECRLYRGNSHFPFKVMIATDYICSFIMTSKELLGKHPVGSLIRLSCDYRLQEYTSIKSDRKPFVVWGSRPSPTLSVNQHFVSPDDSVEVTCTPPANQFAHKCTFRNGEIYIKEGSCRRNLTGRQLGIWEKPALLLPINLGCHYSPYEDLYIQSKYSNRQMVLVIDVQRVTSSVDCKVSVSNEQLETFNNTNWTTVGENWKTVTITVTTSNLTLSETCDYVESQHKPV
ncbi:unnamed protein product [Ophioblennius macclurei]